MNLTRLTKSVADGAHSDVALVVRFCRVWNAGKVQPIGLYGAVLMLRGIPLPIGPAGDAACRLELEKRGHHAGR